MPEDERPSTANHNDGQVSGPMVQAGRIGKVEQHYHPAPAETRVKRWSGPKWRERKRLLVFLLVAAFVVATTVAGMAMTRSFRVATEELFCDRPYVVSGAILAKYRELGGPESALRCPASDQGATPDGRGQSIRFDTSKEGYEQWIYWSSGTGAHPVWGEINRKWVALGREKLGFPTSDEESLRAPWAGQRQGFEHATMYWQPSQTGLAYAVLDDEVGERWKASDRVLGLPTGGETPAPDGRGARQEFDGGSVYWHSPATGAHMVLGNAGGFRDKWQKLLYEIGPLGAPKGDEESTSDREGKRQEFDHGTMYWHPVRSKGAHTVWPDDIGEQWARQGREGGAFGYPVGDEFPTATGCGQTFERGDLTSAQRCSGS